MHVIVGQGQPTRSCMPRRKGATFIEEGPGAQASQAQRRLCASSMPPGQPHSPERPHHRTCRQLKPLEAGAVGSCRAQVIQADLRDARLTRLLADDVVTLSQALAKEESATRLRSGARQAEVERDPWRAAERETVIETQVSESAPESARPRRPTMAPRGPARTLCRSSVGGGRTGAQSGRDLRPGTRGCGIQRNSIGRPASSETRHSLCRARRDRSTRTCLRPAARWRLSKRWPQRRPGCRDCSGLLPTGREGLATLVGQVTQPDPAARPGGLRPSDPAGALRGPGSGVRRAARVPSNGDPDHRFGRG